jgi:hypothetical protein
MIKQISVFVENKPGHLLEIASALAEAGIDIRALSLADTTNYGILRLIVAEPDLALRVLREKELTVSLTDVLAVGVDDQPGGMVRALSALAEKQISVEYMYAFIGGTEDGAKVILRLDNNEAGAAALQEAGVRILQPEELYQL